MKPRKCLGLRPQQFLSFTQALTFPAGYHGSYLLLARDISYTCVHAQTIYRRNNWKCTDMLKNFGTQLLATQFNPLLQHQYREACYWQVDRLQNEMCDYSNRVQPHHHRVCYFPSLQVCKSSSLFVCLPLLIQHLNLYECIPIIPWAHELPEERGTTTEML